MMTKRVSMVTVSCHSNENPNSDRDWRDGSGQGCESQYSQDGSQSSITLVLAYCGTIHPRGCKIDSEKKLTLKNKINKNKKSSSKGQSLTWVPKNWIHEGYVCVLSMHVHVYLYVWRSEDDAGCLLNPFIF